MNFILVKSYQRILECKLKYHKYQSIGWIRCILHIEFLYCRNIIFVLSSCAGYLDIDIKFFVCLFFHNAIMKASIGNIKSDIHQSKLLRIIFCLLNYNLFHDPTHRTGMRF